MLGTEVRVGVGSAVISRDDVTERESVGMEPRQGQIDRPRAAPASSAIAGDDAGSGRAESGAAPVER